MRSEKLLGDFGIPGPQFGHELIFRAPSIRLLLNAPGESCGNVRGALGSDILDDERAHTIRMQARVRLNDASTSRIPEPVEFYFRPPGTTRAADILFERQTLRNYDGTGATTDNTATLHYYAGYFQDRWKPSSRVSIKAGVRFEYVNLITDDREKFLGAILPPNFPTNTSDLELETTSVFPNFGIAFALGKWGVLRGTMSRQHEWIDLGGGVTHFPYVLATDIVRATPRTLAPALNQTLPGGFAVGAAAGRSKDNSESAGRATNNEFSAGWERRLPLNSSISAVFLWRRTWDVKSNIDLNIIRDQNTGQFLGRPFPDYNAVNLTVQRQYQWFQNRSLQILYNKKLHRELGGNFTYWYLITTSARTHWNPTVDTLQFLGFSPADVLSERSTGRLAVERHSGAARLDLELLDRVDRNPKRQVTALALDDGVCDRDAFDVHVGGEVLAAHHVAPAPDRLHARHQRHESSRIARPARVHHERKSGVHLVANRLAEPCVGRRQERLHRGDHDLLLYAAGLEGDVQADDAQRIDDDAFTNERLKAVERNGHSIHAGCERRQRVHARIGCLPNDVDAGWRGSSPSLWLQAPPRSRSRARSPEWTRRLQPGRFTGPFVQGQRHVYAVEIERSKAQ